MSCGECQNFGGPPAQRTVGLVRANSYLSVCPAPMFHNVGPQGALSKHRGKDGWRKKRPWEKCEETWSGKHERGGEGGEVPFSRLCPWHKVLPDWRLESQ